MKRIGCKNTKKIIKPKKKNVQYKNEWKDSKF